MSEEKKRLQESVKRMVEVREAIKKAAGKPTEEKPTSSEKSA